MHSTWRRSRLTPTGPLSVLYIASGEPAAPLLSADSSQIHRDFRADLRLARCWYASNRSVDGLFW